MKRGFVLALVAALLAAPGVQAQEHIVHSFVAAFNAGDVDGLVGLHTPTAVRLPPNAPPVIGRDALREHFLQQLSEPAFVELSAQQEGQHVAESFAVSWGTYDLKVIPEAGAQELTETGHWVSVVQEQYGSDEWLIERTIWNSDSPPPDG